MNNKYLFRIPAFIMAAVSALFIFSCQKMQEDEASPEIMLIIDSANETGYDASLVNPIDGYIAFIQRDDQGRISHMDFLHQDGQSKMTASFYENGLVKSIGGEDYTAVFSNYSGNKVDVAIICGDEIQLFKEYEGSVDWDNPDVPHSETGMGTRAWWEPVDNFLNDLSNNYTLLFFAGSQLEDIVKFAKAGVGANKIGDLSKELAKWGADFFLGGKDLLFGNKATLSKWLDIGEVILTGVLTKGPWGVLISLISNYSSYVDLCEGVFLTFLEWRDGRYGADVELGLATLNSGTGNLKVTLSWNFYADIDVAVVEPNGYVINWTHKRSYYTGGFLDVDNRIGGYGSTENIYWENPVDGTYQVYLDYYGPSELNDLSQCGTCKVTIMYKGVGKVYDVPMDIDDTKTITEITLPNGIYTRSESRPYSKDGIRVDSRVIRPAEPKPAK